MDDDDALPPLDVRPLLPGERAALLALLTEVPPAQWTRPTACPGWDVHALARHLVADDVGLLSRGRDGWSDPAFGAGLDLATRTGLVAAIDRQNTRWVDASRRLSPALTVDLLAWSGERTGAYFAGLDLDAIGEPVDWAGPEPAPVWFELAREYTERWVHQQQIRDAVGQPGLDGAEWLGPVLATFARGLPHALRGAAAPVGARLRLVLDGDGGGVWQVERQAEQWVFVAADAGPVAAEVHLPGAVAWRLWTRGLAPDAARASATIAGDAALAERVFAMTTIIA